MTSVAVRRALATVALPYLRLQLPGWRRVASGAGLPIRHVAQWADVPPRTIRSKTHRLLMHLEMQDWCERLTYFLGRYYEVAVERLVERLVLPGDTFVDVGANIGMLTLTGASRVGTAGHVYAFEPHPRMASRIRHAIALNGLRNVTVLEYGLADCRAEMPLTVAAQANGWSTLGAVTHPDPSLSYGTIPVNVDAGDNLLPANMRGAVTIKVDAEGFETRVLRGLTKVIERTQPAVITEVEPDVLRAAGSSVEELFGVMNRHGYDAYDITLRPTYFSEDLLLTPAVSPAEVSTNNVVWLHPSGIHFGRVMSNLASVPQEEGPCRS